jgi:hypothetical protein
MSNELAAQYRWPSLKHIHESKAEKEAVGVAHTAVEAQLHNTKAQLEALVQQT